MSIEIRACRDAEELASYGEVIAYAFAVNDRASLQTELDAVRPEWTTCAFDNGKAVSTLGTIPFSVQLNGRTVPIGGVTGVGTLPGYRRTGLLRQTMTAALQRMHDEGTPLALLWASLGAIYQRFGYGIASPLLRYTFDPRLTGLLPGYGSTGRCELVPLEHARARIEPVYAAFAAPRNLLLNRTDFLWNSDILRQKPQEARYVMVYRDVTGMDTGYVVYSTREEEAPRRTLPPQILEVQDIAWLNLDAYTGLWECLREHDMVREVRMRWMAGEDDPMPLMLSEPRALNTTSIDGTWMRVVDAREALAARPYAGAGRLRIGIRDDLCPWNHATWELETDGPSSTVRSATGTPDISMPIASLATLLTGHRNSSTLARAGRIDPAPAAVLHEADRIFATDYAPYTPNMF